jgi:hypothetical protein
MARAIFQCSGFFGFLPLFCAKAFVLFVFIRFGVVADAAQMLERLKHPARSPIGTA